MVRPTFYSCRCGQFCTLLKEEFVGGYVARPDPSAQVRTTVGRRLRVSLEIVTERGLVRQEWVTPIPVQSAADIARSAGRMLSQSRLMAPMTHLSIAVYEIGIPETHTANLFGVQSDAVAMGAVMGRAERRGGGGQPIGRDGHAPASCRDAMTGRTIFRTFGGCLVAPNNGPIH